MPRPDMSSERRREFLPILARTFAEFGYRRATTAELARNCGVKETILYRLWPDKRGMFIAALDLIYELSEQTWVAVLADAGEGASPAAVILEYEATHHGEFGLHRLVFAGLSETDDPEIRQALQRLYGRLQTFARDLLQNSRDSQDSPTGPDPEIAAWAFLGLGSVVNIGRELEMISDTTRKQLFEEIGGLLLHGAARRP